MEEAGEEFEEDREEFRQKFTEQGLSKDVSLNVFPALWGWLKGEYPDIRGTDDIWEWLGRHQLQETQWGKSRT